MPDIGYLWVVWLAVAVVGAPAVGRMFRRMGAQYPRYTENESFVERSKLNRDGSLPPVESWYRSQPVPVGYDEHEQGFVDAERVA